MISSIGFWYGVPEPDQELNNPFIRLLANTKWKTSVFFYFCFFYSQYHASPLLSWCAGGELQEAREALARADSSSSDSEDETNSKKKKDQDKPTEEVNIDSYFLFYTFRGKIYSLVLIKT